jgi:predicted Zn finger-like uncharacterized protein
MYYLEDEPAQPETGRPLMQIACANCQAKYRIDEARLADVKRKNPKCKICGGHVFAQDDVAAEQSAQETVPAEMPESVGPYRIEAMIGKGAMGYVYKGWDESLRRHAAVKMLSPAFYSNEEGKHRFLVEARALAKLVHPNITQIYSAGEEGGEPYFAMEYVDGPSTQQMLARSGRLDPLEAIRIVKAACEGLKHAQASGVIHRDIKPGNILVHRDGTPKITDFGIAKLSDEDHRLTSTGMIVGTPSYIAPEQAKGDALDFRADIYSLGATLYELVMGKPPFAADSAMTLLMKHINEPVRFPVSTHEAAIPPPLTGVIRKMMAKNPDARYLSYDHLINDLTQVETRLAAEQKTIAEASTSSASTTQAPAAATGEQGLPIMFKLVAVAAVLWFGYLGIRHFGVDEQPVPAPVSAPVAQPAPPPLPAVPAPTRDAAPVPSAGPLLADRRLADTAIQTAFVEIIDESSFRIFGTLRNMESSPVDGLEVEAMVFDADNEFLAEQSAQCEPKVVLPGESARFSILFRDVKNMDHYEVRAFTYEDAGRR